MGSTQCAERVHLNSLLWVVGVSLTHGYESLTDLLHLRGLVGVKGPPPLRIVEKEPGIEGRPSPNGYSIAVTVTASQPGFTMLMPDMLHSIQRAERVHLNSLLGHS
jgi:hypothetical protein